MGTPYDEDDGIPNNTTEWASDGLHVLEPAAGKEVTGWVLNDVPGSNNENWLKRNIYRWEKYFKRAPLDIIQHGVWDPPSVSVAGGTGGVDPTFTIGSFVVVSQSGKRLPFSGGDFTPSPSAGTVEPLRADGVFWKLDEVSNEWEWAYIEDVFGVGFSSVTSEHHLLFTVSVQEDAVDYEIATPTDLAIKNARKSSMVKNHLYVSGSYDPTNGEEYVGIFGIQQAIDNLASRQGGIVEVEGSWLGKWDWQGIDKIKVKSGVTVKTESGALITTPSTTYSQDPIDTVFEMVGYEGTIYFNSATEIQDDVDLNQNFDDFGKLSMVQILSGPNEGFYLFQDFLVVGGDPSDQFRGAKMTTLYREPVAFTDSISAPYIVWIMNSNILAIGIDGSKMPLSGGESLIRAGYTWNCKIRENNLRAENGGDIDFGIDLSYGPNHGLGLDNNEIIGTFSQGVITDELLENERCTVTENIVDLSASIGISDGITFKSSGAGDNLIHGNNVDASGTKESYDSSAGWNGYPALIEHNENGSHKANIIGVDEINASIAGAGLMGGSGSALSLGDQGLWLLASMSVLADASGPQTIPLPPMREIAKAKDGTDESPVAAGYLGTGAFDVSDGSYPWNIRLVSGSGSFQIRPPCTMLAGVITPKYVSGDVVVSCALINNSFMGVYTIDYDVTGVDEEYWHITTFDMAGVSDPKPFQITFNKSTV
jgi:hypothetical protein